MNTQCSFRTEFSYFLRSFLLLSFISRVIICTNFSFSPLYHSGNLSLDALLYEYGFIFTVLPSNIVVLFKKSSMNTTWILAEVVDDVDALVGGLCESLRRLHVRLRPLVVDIGDALHAVLVHKEIVYLCHILITLIAMCLQLANHRHSGSFSHPRGKPIALMSMDG